jgi:hypothetical protein
VASCNTPTTVEPKTEIIDIEVDPSDYVTRTTDSGDEDFVQILNDEISPDREIELYYSDYLLDGYWGMIIDYDILVSASGGEVLIYDDDHSYEGSTIRVIVTWYEEEEIEYE